MSSLVLDVLLLELLSKFIMLFKSVHVALDLRLFNLTGIPYLQVH